MGVFIGQIYTQVSHICTLIFIFVISTFIVMWLYEYNRATAKNTQTLQILQHYQFARVWYFWEQSLGKFLSYYN